jgi:hypothetical protein
MKKKSFLFVNCLLLCSAVFGQGTQNIKNILVYEPHVVVKKAGVYSLVKLQSFKVVDSKSVQIKGTITSSFELVDLRPANIVTKSILINEIVSTSQIWVSQNGGLDTKQNRIWIALNLSNLAGIDEYLENDREFDYPQF